MTAERSAPELCRRCHNSGMVDDDYFSGPCPSCEIGKRNNAMTTPAQIREYLAFADSTDLKVLQDAVDEVKAIARSASMDNAMQVYAAKCEVLDALYVQYNRVSRAKKVMA